MTGREKKDQKGKDCLDMQANESALQQLFSQAYILGGSPCSGKSTIAEKLCAQYEFEYYRVDDHDSAHIARCRPDRHPVMFNYSKMPWNTIWMRPVSLQVQEEFEFYRERFEMIVQDLAGYTAGSTLLLEGAAYYPDLIWPYAGSSPRVIYMVPTKAFQVQHYRQRPWIHHILSECEDPEQAFENWMARDALFGQEVLNQAKTYEYRTIVVDGTCTVDEQYEQVRGYLGLAS